MKANPIGRVVITGLSRYGRSVLSRKCSSMQPPNGMSQQDFDNEVIKYGDAYESKKPYSATGGPNSNTATDNIIERAGGVAPDVSGAYRQNYGE